MIIYDLIIYSNMDDNSIDCLGDSKTYSLYRIELQRTNEIRRYLRYTPEKKDLFEPMTHTNAYFVNDECNSDRVSLATMLTLLKNKVDGTAPIETFISRINSGRSVQAALFTPCGAFSGRPIGDGRKIVANGETHTIREWSRISGIKEVTIRNRLNSGWDPVDAVTVPTYVPYARRRGSS